MFRRILVAIDGSADARQALVEAIELSHATKAKLSVMTVVPTADPRALGAGDHVPAGRSELQRQAERVLGTAIAAWVPDDMPVTAIARRGAVAPAIVDEAKTGNHDLVVVGARGLGERRSQLGSVSHAVLQSSPVAVRVAQAAAGGGASDDTPRTAEWSLLTAACLR